MTSSQNLSRQTRAHARGLSIGVIGAGRVGAVLTAALHQAGHRIAAVAGESDASRTRIETLLARCPDRQADRCCQGRRPAAAHRPRRRPRQRREDARRVRRDPLRSVRRPHERPARHGGAAPRARDRRVRHRDAPGHDVHRHRRRPRPAAWLRLRRDDVARRAARRRRAWSRARWTVRADRRVQPHALPRGARTRRQPPRHPGLAGDGRAARRRLDRPGRHPAPLLTAALDNALDYGDAALTGPIVRGDVETVRLHVAEPGRRQASRARRSSLRRDGACHRQPRRRRRAAGASPSRRAGRGPQRRPDRRPRRRSTLDRVRRSNRASARTSCVARTRAELADLVASSGSGAR